MTQKDVKLERLRAILSEMKGVVLGYSGGVDSTLLGAVASEVLGDHAVCVLASSQTNPASLNGLRTPRLAAARRPGR